jgi:hypothetical protein
MRQGRRGIRRMRLRSLAIAAVAVTLSACAPHLVDPQDAAERMVAGMALGTALGTGLGATLSINPAIGAVIGAETGAALGGFTGIITAAPVPAYHAVPVPAQAVIPHFYDGWPPGYHRPPDNPETLPPPAG